ncbi:damage-inducible protein DinB [Vibrio sp.]|nr:damage-inducible protein DinB [Vibrio sp.]
MGLLSNFKMLARYNQRMNQQLLDVCSRLTHEQLHKNMGSFFPTVMAHWNHILFGDVIMLNRLVANNLVSIENSVLEQLPVPQSTGDTFASNLEEFIPIRTLIDSIYVDVMDGFTMESGQCIVQYTTTEGQAIQKTMGEFCQHLFNHQTHHRGQLTCLISQLGLDFGCTDLPMIVPEGTSIE